MGVLTYTYPYSTFNSITYTAKRWGYYPIVTYIPGAVAGQEVVTTDASHNIFVQIESGVSTNAQVKAAIDATIPSGNSMAAGDYVTVTVPISRESDSNIPGSSPVMAGAIAPVTQGYYSDEYSIPLTSTYQIFQFPLVARHLTIHNRGKNTSFNIVYSWDGINIHGLLEASQSITFDNPNVAFIFLKYSNGAPSYKLMVKTSF